MFAKPIALSYKSNTNHNLALYSIPSFINIIYMEPAYQRLNGNKEGNNYAILNMNFNNNNNNHNDYKGNNQYY